MMEDAIYTLLSGFASGRVYALRAPQNSPTPFIVYQRIGSERWRSINNPSGIGQAVIQIDAYADTFADSKNLAAQIESALDGFRGLVYYGSNSPQDVVNIGGITLSGDNDLLDQTEEPFLYRNTANYLVTYHY
jgi:hypothetical protein